MPAPAVPYRSMAMRKRLSEGATARREDAKSRAKLHEKLRVSRQAETTYVLEIQRIMGQVHKGVLHVVHREHLGLPAPPAEERRNAADVVFVSGGDLPGEVTVYVPRSRTLRADADPIAMPTSGLLPVPVVRQSSPYACGAAAVLSLLRYWLPGFEGTAETELHELLGTTPADGTEPGPLARALVRAGLSAALETGTPTISSLEAAVAAGQPPILCLQAYKTSDAPWSETWDAGHYVVVVGFDAERIFVVDPSSGYAYIPRAELDERWHDVVGRRSHKKTQRIAIFAGGHAPPQVLAPLAGAAARLDAATEPRQDAGPTKVGLGDELLRRMMLYVKPQTQAAFDRMAKQVSAKADPAMRQVLERDLERRIREKQALRPIALPASMRSFIDKSRERNVALITNASHVFLQQVRQVLRDNEGGRPEHIATLLQQRVGVSQSRGQLIARTETLKLHGQINRFRQTEAGVKRFVWSTSKDSRVRPSHAEIEGVTFSWDDDAREEEMADYDISDDDPGNPAPICGDAPNCRCVALPVVEELEEGEEPEAEGEETEQEPDETEGGEEEPDEEEEGEEGDEPDDEGLGLGGTAAAAIAGAGLAGEGEEEPEEGAEGEGGEEGEASEVDWDAIGDLEKQAADLVESGDMTPFRFAELWRQGLEASDGDEDALSDLALFKPE
jgi:SPP1 gp7 family putative phage head morphogenesis protein